MESQSKNEQLLVLTDVIKVLVSNVETNNTYAIFEETVPPFGRSPSPLPSRRGNILCTARRVRVYKNDLNSPFRALPGSVVHVSSNEIHTFKNVGDSPGKMIVMLTPGKLLDYFRAIGEPLDEKTGYPDLEKIPDCSKLNVEKVFKHAVDHNVEFILPKIAEN